MSHWLLDNLNDERQKALKQASHAQVCSELLNQPFGENAELIGRSAEALEMVVHDLLLEGVRANADRQATLKACAADAFRLLRVLPRPADSMDSGMFLLRAGALAVLGDMGSDAARWLREDSWAGLPLDSDSWGERTWATILDIWLRLIRKHGWSDRDAVLERIVRLREAQSSFERDYLDNRPATHAKASALELIGLYHLAKAAEVLALYITDGVVDGNYQIHQLLDTHFDRVMAVCRHAQLVNLEPLSRLLAAASAQMASNSIWTVTRAVNSRVTAFVRALVDRGRGDRAIFDVLPPQRRALAERGLLGSSRRAVVVSLPTSSGKTLIAQFRILQALNQFEHERGWVAYLAPTRTLVNQVARRLRRDFESLTPAVVVEQVSPALEIDSIEVELLSQHDSHQEFRVLVTTPEKLDLMLRQGWEEKIGRPLTLVVVDEAHNIQGGSRGLRLELLLATINTECQRAQFLLLTPFIQNARDVARWLGGPNSDDVSLALDWQPNDRVIGVVQAEQGEALNRRSHDYSLRLDTVHTTRNTLAVEEAIQLPKIAEIASTFRQASDQSTLAAITAQALSERGPVIVMHSRPDWVWSLAGRLKVESNRTAPSADVELVQQFLSMEFGESFPLIELLSYGIGVHHAGLSDDIRMLMEWLFEKNELRFLVATTTIAQGVNFPVSGVVMASHQYPASSHPFWTDMPPEDFWNIAGRAGRISQGTLGVVSLVASDSEKAAVLKTFINRQAGNLNSALIAIATEAGELMSNLELLVYNYPEWSSFLQYLAHTYRQMGKPESFADQVEQVLRSTFGFEMLRSQNAALAGCLLDGIRTYAQYLARPNQPLSLVDSTGFSLQSINTVLKARQEEGITQETWNGQSLFSASNHDLENLMGVLLRVPELRENLEAVTGGQGPDGNKLALIVKDWVNGASIPDIATRYFMGSDNDLTHAITKCGKNLYGNLTQTAAWGLGALLSITGQGIPEEEYKVVRNLPSRVYYGVNSDAAIALRLLGVPRAVASQLADSMGDVLESPLPAVRSRLRSMDESGWTDALGAEKGQVYRKVWQILEGLEEGA